MGRITVVTSGKGGAGKSTVSAALGCALARRGCRVLIIDGDAGLRSLDLMLGVSSMAVYDLADIFSGRCELIKAVYASPLCKDVFVIPAPADLESRCSPHDMARLCRSFAQYYDEVIVDCPAGIGRGFATAVEGATRAVVVATPDTVCARDAYIVAERLLERKIPVQLLINRLRPAPILAGRMPDVDEIMDQAGLPLLGILPEDEQVAVANANGEPLPISCRAFDCMDRIAGRFLGEDIPLSRLEK